MSNDHHVTPRALQKPHLPLAEPPGNIDSDPKRALWRENPLRSKQGDNGKDDNDDDDDHPDQDDENADDDDDHDDDHDDDDDDIDDGDDDDEAQGQQIGKRA